MQEGLDFEEFPHDRDGGGDAPAPFEKFEIFHREQVLDMPFEGLAVSVRFVERGAAVCPLQQVSDEQSLSHRSAHGIEYERPPFGVFFDEGGRRHRKGGRGAREGGGKDDGEHVPARPEAAFDDGAHLFGGDLKGMAFGARAQAGVKLFEGERLSLPAAVADPVQRIAERDFGYAVFFVKFPRHAAAGIGDDVELSLHMQTPYFRGALSCGPQNHCIRVMPRLQPL